VPTPLGAIVGRTRTQILAPLVQSGAISPDQFWSDAELLAHTVAGCKDLWRAVVDLHQDHFVAINTAVVLPAAADALVGVPSDCFRILYMQPRDPNGSGLRPVRFRRASLTSHDFVRAQQRTAIDPTSAGGIVYCALVNAGSPVMTPDIHVAPRVTSALAITLAYVPTLPGTLTADSMNPIPGESDHALMAWTAAYALGKQNPDGTLTPDQTWLAVYSTEKESIKIVIEPRDASSPQIVRGVFDDTFGPGLSGYGFSSDDVWD
jgi:hypothetical protein